MLSITKIDVVSLIFLKLTALALILHLNLADILLTSIYFLMNIFSGTLILQLIMSHFAAALVSFAITF